MDTGGVLAIDALGNAFALYGDDIVSVLNDDAANRGAVHAMLQLAIAEGGRRLDAFDTVLPGFYAAHGRKPVARLRWDDECAPPGWDKASYARYNGGEPDVVFMALDPSRYGPYDGTEGPVADSPEAATQLQREAPGGGAMFPRKDAQPVVEVHALRGREVAGPASYHAAHRSWSVGSSGKDIRDQPSLTPARFATTDEALSALRAPGVRLVRRKTSPLMAGSSDAWGRGPDAMAVEIDKDAGADSNAFTRAVDAAVSLVNAAFATSASGKELRRRLARWAKDSYVDVRLVQESIRRSGGTITGAADLYQAVTPYPGKTGAQMRAFERKFVEPLESAIESAVQKGASVDGIEDWRIARRAAERNAVIRGRTEGKNDAGSGMPDAEAKARDLQEQLVELYDLWREGGITFAELESDYRRLQSVWRSNTAQDELKQRLAAKCADQLRTSAERFRNDSLATEDGDPKFAQLTAEWQAFFVGRFADDINGKKVSLAEAFDKAAEGTEATRSAGKEAAQEVKNAVARMKKAEQKRAKEAERAQQGAMEKAPSVLASLTPAEKARIATFYEYKSWNGAGARRFAERVAQLMLAGDAAALVTAVPAKLRAVIWRVLRESGLSPSRKVRSDPSEGAAGEQRQGADVGRPRNSRAVEAHRRLGGVSYARRSGAGGGARPVVIAPAGQEIEPIGAFDPDPAFAAQFNAAGLATPALFDLPRSAAGAFRAAIESSKASGTFSSSVCVYPEEKYAEMRLFVAAGGKTGFPRARRRAHRRIAA